MTSNPVPDGPLAEAATQAAQTALPAPPAQTANAADAECKSVTIEWPNALEALEAYLDSEMTDADAARFRDHLSGCEQCSATMSTEELVRKLVRRACEERAPEHLTARIRERIAVECETC
jgi:mycothiol system anti-sigma-R factor